MYGKVAPKNGQKQPQINNSLGRLVTLSLCAFEHAISTKPILCVLSYSNVHIVTVVIVLCVPPGVAQRLNKTYYTQCSGFDFVFVFDSLL